MLSSANVIILVSRCFLVRVRFRGELQSWGEQCGFDHIEPRRDEVQIWIPTLTRHEDCTRGLHSQRFQTLKTMGLYWLERGSLSKLSTFSISARITNLNCSARPQLLCYTLLEML